MQSHTYTQEKGQHYNNAITPTYTQKQGKRQ